MKPVYSAKPGQILDYEGKPIKIYDNNSEPKRLEQWSREFSEKRRKEIKKELEAKMIIRTFKREINAQLRLKNQLK